MTTTMSMQKPDKKFGGKYNHGSPHVTHSSSPRQKVTSTAFAGTNLQIEVVEVREAPDKKASLVGGPYVCILEVTDPSVHQTVWKQKSSAQFTNKPPIYFGDIFKVKNLSGDWGVDIKPGYSLKVHLTGNKSDKQLDSASLELEDLIVNKEQQKVLPLPDGNAEVVLRLTPSNTQYPRGNHLTLSEIAKKEKEKEEKEKEKEAEPQSGEDKSSVQRTASYRLPSIIVRFSIIYNTVPDEQLRVVGSGPKLGDWDANKSPTMSWTEGGVWRLEVPFRKAYFPFEYKYVVFNSRDASVRWESVPNRKVELSSDDLVNRDDAWDK